MTLRKLAHKICARFGTLCLGNSGTGHCSDCRAVYRMLKAKAKRK